MKKILLYSMIGVGIIAAGYMLILSPASSSRLEYERFLSEHTFRETLNEQVGESESSVEGDHPDLAMMQDYLLTMDPALKRPTPWVLAEPSIQTARMRDNEKNSVLAPATSLATGTAWTERGPKQVGGITRAFMFDPNDVTRKKVWAGGVSGGLWSNVDITNAISPWVKVDDFWDNLSISCMDADPVNPLIFYVGTGEFEYTVRGGGIWKTVDGGLHWSRISGTENFLEIRDIEVRNESGTSVIYVAVRPGYGDDNPTYSAGLYRSANGGTTWTQVLPFAQGSSTYTNLPTDIEIGPDNTIWVAAAKHYWENNAFSTIYKSSTGLAGSWTAISSFTASNLSFTGRIELAVAPSDANRVYAIVEQDNKVGAILKSTNKGTSWTAMPTPVAADIGIPVDDFSRGQAWYDLILAVSPTDAETCLVGTIDLYRTSNGGTNWAQISKWSNNANMNTLTCSVVHADQHNIVFRPGLSNEAVFTNDGGVFYTNNLSSAATSDVISARNLNYNVTQFYTAALHPTLPDYMLGGAQDNGTPKFTLPGFGTTVDVYGGDGAMCFIDQKDPTFQIVSYVRNVVALSANGGTSFPISLINDGATGLFINKGDYDSNVKALYMSKSSSEIYRVRNVTTTHDLDNVSIDLGSMGTAFRVSPFPATATNLYIGTEAGKLFKVLNAHAASPTITEITGANFPTGSISGITFGATENQIAVSFFNYGVTNIWETRNGGSTWTSREGNLPNMPVRWIEYHPQNFDQLYIATELGVWSTDNVNVASPVWTSTNGGLANVRTDMLRIRKTDGRIMAATFGRGVFTALVPSNLDQTIAFKQLPATKTFGDQSFKIWAESTSKLPITFQSGNTAVATIVDSTVTIVGAGSATITASQAGDGYYSAAPSVQRTLVVSKANQTITFGALAEKDVDDADFNVSATSTSGLAVSFSSSNAAVASVIGNTVSINGPGTAIITATQAGNSNYNSATSVPQNLNVVTRIISLNGDLDFGEVFIGQSPEKTFTITNTGTGQLDISNIVFPEGYTGDTEVVSGNIQVTVTFAPTEEADFAGNIEVVSNATSGINLIPVAGTGILITATEETSMQNEVTVYPNPSMDMVRIQTKSTPPLTVSIVDVGGRQWEQLTIPESENIVQLNISNLTSGIYILKIRTPNGFIRKNLFKL
jgi:hypothetical protein